LFSKLYKGSLNKYLCFKTGEKISFTISINFFISKSSEFFHQIILNFQAHSIKILYEKFLDKTFFSIKIFFEAYKNLST
jgi:hypothetical protein